MMTKIEAIIRPHKLEDLREELMTQGITGMTVTEVRGFGRQRGHKEIYRGREYEVHYLSKLKVEVVVKTEQVESLVDSIRKTVSTGQVGDGKIFLYDVNNTIRIRTGEREIEAL
jgi:nitrogen regulatory protein PII